VLTLKCTSSHATANPADIVYVGKANAYPNQIKSIRGVTGSTATVTDRKEFFKISYSFTKSAGVWEAVDATLPKWSSTDSTASSWTNSVSANNNGTHIEISNIVVGGMGTVTATLTANVLIKKWGTEDVTMTLDVDPAFIDGA
jgi:hypothetical protein